MIKLQFLGESEAHEISSVTEFLRHVNALGFEDPGYLVKDYVHISIYTNKPIFACKDPYLSEVDTVMVSNCECDLLKHRED